MSNVLHIEVLVTKNLTHNETGVAIIAADGYGTAALSPVTLDSFKELYPTKLSLIEATLSDQAMDGCGSVVDGEIVFDSISGLEVSGYDEVMALESLD
jgi:DNA-binding transcriptional LysR family regulator